MEKFQVREYPLYELAQLYYPELCMRSACRLFSRELRETRGLWRALGDVGFKRYAKS